MFKDPLDVCEIRLKSWVKVVMVAIMVMLMFGCTGIQNKDPADQVITVTLRGLQTAKEFRLFALGTANKFWRKGMLSEEVAERIATVGDELQAAINETSDALEDYLTTKGASADKLNANIALYQKLYTQFSELVTPYIMEAISDGEP